MRFGYPYGEYPDDTEALINDKLKEVMSIAGITDQDGFVLAIIVRDAPDGKNQLMGRVVGRRQVDGHEIQLDRALFVAMKTAHLHGGCEHCDPDDTQEDDDDDDAPKW
jgi:hypothetical protein